jgi:hypothetical protein
MSDDYTSSRPIGPLIRRGARSPVDRGEQSSTVPVVLRGIVNGVPIGLLVVVVVGLAVGIVVSAVLLVRRLVPATREGFDAEISSQMLGVVASLFGLLLAFVVVIEYQSFNDAQENVLAEADSLAAIVRDSDAFPDQGGERVRLAVGAYVRAVVDDEWPRMRDGRESARASSAIDAIYNAFRGVEPASPMAQSFYEDSVRQLNDALIARRNRLAANRDGLPSLILALILIGSIVILGYATLVGSRSFWFHAIGAGAIALVVAFSLVVLLNLSFPFSGILAVDPSPFRSGVLSEFFATPE